ncbi:hypothetical protein SAMN04515674_104245 [Pseudarcicella hirudinis]|uniref:Uncharacterized protein n=1 Tax=Pseudarcicella hirudinis TaxID=1079859 RepID=A0A1I5RU03_9BACT|nr:hypothetical protein [Pseudarcicella hirudinis]SFP62015.1 hypothetical protein SAMN04515674_104245 [Pseudarcicella hirudinis]
MATDVVNMTPLKNGIIVPKRFVCDSGAPPTTWNDLSEYPYEICCLKEDFSLIYSGVLHYAILKKKIFRPWWEIDAIKFIEYDEECGFSNRSIQAVITHVRPFEEKYDILFFKIIGTCNI